MHASTPPPSDAPFLPTPLALYDPDAPPYSAGAPPYDAGAPPDAAGPPSEEGEARPKRHRRRAHKRVEFTGSGREYFRIWTVNLCLSALTLGLYSPWAKARRLQYFYRHTRLGRAGFDYHGRPLAILKGRLVVAALVAAYYGAAHLTPAGGVLVAVAVFLGSPWFIVRALKFRLANTSYRGLRFDFRGEARRAAGVTLGWGLVALATCYLFFPSLQWRLKKFEYENTSFGDLSFDFHAKSGWFYSTYFLGALFAAPLVLVGSALGAAITEAASWWAGGPATEVATVATSLAALVSFAGFRVVVAPYVQARLQREIWSTLALGPHGFACDLRPGDVTWLALKNFALTVATLGFYAPFAAIAMAKARLESVSLLPGAPLGRLRATGAGEQSGVSDAVGDLVDYDLGF